MDIIKEVPLRARFEHYKSTANERKIYATLGYVALPEGLFVEYVAEYDDKTIWLRQAEEFAGYAKSGTKRFTLLEEDALTIEARDEVLAEERIEKDA